MSQTDNATSGVWALAQRRAAQWSGLIAFIVYFLHPLSMSTYPGRHRDSTRSTASASEDGWRRHLRPEAICLVVGMAAALFLTWTIKPESGWESILKNCAWILGSGTTTVLAYLPDAFGVAALLIVIGGTAKVVTSSIER